MGVYVSLINAVDEKDEEKENVNVYSNTIGEANTGAWSCWIYFHHL